MPHVYVGRDQARDPSAWRRLRLRRLDRLRERATSVPRRHDLFPKSRYPDTLRLADEMTRTPFRLQSGPVLPLK
jgi:hypothetical protein